MDTGLRRYDERIAVKIDLRAVVHALPAGFAALRAEARANGHNMLDRLADEWASGAMRFDHPGEALLAAYVGDVLAGIGGLTLEPSVAGAMRMRRFYTAIAFRRAGIAHALASRLLEGSVSGIVTANAARGSEKFWEASGFRQERGATYTHILIRDRRPGSRPPAAARSD